MTFDYPFRSSQSYQLHGNFPSDSKSSFKILEMRNSQCFPDVIVPSYYIYSWCLLVAALSTHIHYRGFAAVSKPLFSLPYPLLD